MAGEPSRAGLCCLSTGERVLLLCPGMQKASRESRGFVTLGRGWMWVKHMLVLYILLLLQLWVLYSIVGSIYIYHCWSYIFHCCFTYIAELLVSLLVNNRDWCGLYNRNEFPMVIVVALIIASIAGFIYIPSCIPVKHQVNTSKVGKNNASWIIPHHHFIDGMFAIPSHVWFMILCYSHFNTRNGRCWASWSFLNFMLVFHGLNPGDQCWIWFEPSLKKIIPQTLA